MAAREQRESGPPGHWYSVVDPHSRARRYCRRFQHTGRAAGPGRGAARGAAPLPMSMIARSAVLSCLLLAALSLVPAPVRAAIVAPLRPERPLRSADAQATQLLQRAERQLALQTIETRRMAITDLERAADLAPLRIDVQLVLARAYYQAGFLKQSRTRFERALALAPDDPRARYGLGQAWRRDWLKYLERRSLDRAVDHYAAAGRLDTMNVETWLMLSALQVERGELTLARDAAEHALRSDRARAEAQLAAASTRWRTGDVTGADSLFRSALSRLRRSLRDRFEDIAPLATEKDTVEYNHLAASKRTEYSRRFWREHDPDLATPENEAQLEYWARVSQAYFLYYDVARRRWDERGEIYVRYGAPDSAAYNPIGTSLYGYSSGTQMRFPVNALVWQYRALGMSVTLHDRMLSERYELPVSMDRDLDPVPNADALAKLDVVSTHGRRGVFPLLPPMAKALEVHAQVAAFEGGDGGGLMFAGVSAAGEPADTLAADLVVLDSLYHEVARVHSMLSPSACEAATLRVAAFNEALPSGDYLVGTSVRGGGKRGSVRTSLHVAAPDSTLSMSDLVVTCGVPATLDGGVRLDPNPTGSVRAGEALVVYFEVYHLGRGPDGQGRFEYETSVRSARRDTRVWLQRLLSPRREGQDLGMTRQDAVLGTLRRQFVSIPVQALPPGRFALEITVRDVLTGDSQKRSVEFLREP